MLNLLIAIISDSFAKIMALQEQTSTYECLQFIYDRKSRYSQQTIQDFKKKYEKGVILSVKKDEDKGETEDIRRILSSIDLLDKRTKKMKISQNIFMDMYKENKKAN